jgi:hypothetical protein
MTYIAVLITFGLLALADKYRYRAPQTLSTRGLLKRTVTVEPLNESTLIERANPGNSINFYIN